MLQFVRPTSSNFMRKWSPPPQLFYLCTREGYHVTMEAIFKCAIRKHDNITKMCLKEHRFSCKILKQTPEQRCVPTDVTSPLLVSRWSFYLLLAANLKKYPEEEKHGRSCQKRFWMNKYSFSWVLFSSVLGRHDPWTPTTKLNSIQMWLSDIQQLYSFKIMCFTL